MPSSPLHAPVLDWYAEHARDLPWRVPRHLALGRAGQRGHAAADPGARVEPVYRAWLQRWPTPGGARGRTCRRGGPGLGAARLSPPGAAAARRRDRGGRPARRRAARVVRRRCAPCPASASTPRPRSRRSRHGARHAVLDTNVRRVLARARGRRRAAGACADRGRAVARAESVVPDDPAAAARWAVAVMELGALVCTARAPRCDGCPVAAQCAWRQAGSPAYDGPVRRSQAFAGTDRQVRGLLMAVLRDRPGPAGAEELAAVWADAGAARPGAGRPARRRSAGRRRRHLPPPLTAPGPARVYAPALCPPLAK